MKEKRNPKFYYPLPEYLELRKSEIHGFGLFATEDIKADTCLGISHCHMSDGEIIRTPLGAFYNHSKEPNCKRVYETHEPYDYLMTIKNIKAGDELTAFYTLPGYEELTK